MDHPYNSAIHERAIEVIENRRYNAECLEADICPKCGHALESDMDDHGFVDYTCAGCGEKYFGK